MCSEQDEQDKARERAELIWATAAGKTSIAPVSNDGGTVELSMNPYLMGSTCLDLSLQQRLSSTIALVCPHRERLLAVDCFCPRSPLLE